MTLAVTVERNQFRLRRGYGTKLKEERMSVLRFFSEPVFFNLERN